jgi:capsular polysaccharide biosynthesis protein
VIVGASGAALANALFAGPQARVVELMPEGFAHPWVRDLCLRVGCEWRGWFAEGRAGGLAALPHSLRRGFAFAWRLDVPAFLAWCDADGGL